MTLYIIWIDKHGMPAHRMGRLWTSKKDEVDEWVKAGGADQTSRNGIVMNTEKYSLPFTLGEKIFRLEAVPRRF